MLKSLEITGFKSFAKKSILEFRTPISAIVGPNGSGKSNIAEAFRFVLGEQSIKSMRGKKGEDLIFNGSPSAQRHNRASVKVSFDNSRRNLDIDFDEVSIERIVHRDGINEYLVNDSEVRLRDVVELLAKAHIGASGHHMISQGEADRILSVSSKERKGMIEDALGLKIYQYKKEESLRKLAKTEENIKTVEGLRREIAPHLRFLKKQMEKIEKTLETKKELELRAREYLFKESAYLKIGKSKVALEKKAPEKKLVALASELERAQGVVAKSGKSDASFAEAAALLEKLERVRARISSLERELGRIEGEINSTERNIKRRRETSAAGGAFLVPSEKLESLRREVLFFIGESEKENDFSKLKQIIAGIKKVFADFFEKNRSAGTPDEYAKKDAEELEILQGKKSDIEAEIKNERKSEAELAEKHANVREKIEKDKDSFKEAEKEIYRITAAQNEAKSALSLLEAREGRLLAEEDEYEREVAEITALVGRGVLAFGEGRFAPEEETAGEDRRAQEERKKNVEKLKIRLEDQGVSGSDDTVNEYRETSERDAFLERELDDLVSSAASLGELIKDLEKRLSAEFESGIEKINREFGNFLRTMFGGGEAGIFLSVQKKKKRKETDLELGDILQEEEKEAEEETEEGIEISVSLPHKKIKGLMMLSGGERALVSIALLFAISQVNPPPFVILDETDAALDEANSKRYSDMVKELSCHSQLILITHNRETMHAAGVLYGVTMGADGVSKLLSVNLEEAAGYAK